MLEAETLIRLHGLRRDENTEKSASEAETTPKDFGAETLKRGAGAENTEAGSNS